MKSNRQLRAFTLIELLVVIAIIGILSAVVLGSLNNARNKGVDAAVKSNLNNSRAQAELFNDANGNVYLSGAAGGAGDVCSPSALVAGVKGTYAFLQGAATSAGVAVNATSAAGNYTNATCHSSANGWVMSAPLKSSPGMVQPMYCVDSTGKSVVKDVTGGGSEPAAGSPAC